MSKVSLNLSPSLHELVVAISAEEGVSVDQFIATAVAEKVATLQTADYLRTRSERGSREKLLAVLAQAPEVEPEEADRI